MVGNEPPESEFEHANFSLSKQFINVAHPQLSIWDGLGTGTNHFLPSPLSISAAAAIHRSSQTHGSNILQSQTAQLEIQLASRLQTTTAPIISVEKLHHAYPLWVPRPLWAQTLSLSQPLRLGPATFLSFVHGYGIHRVSMGVRKRERGGGVGVAFEEREAEWNEMKTLGLSVWYPIDRKMPYI